MTRRTAANRQRRERLERKGREPTEPEYDANNVEAARAVDGKAMRARGEVPPWEETDAEQGERTAAA